MQNDQVQMSVLRINHHSPKHCAERWPYAAYGSNLMLAQIGERCPKVDIVGSGTLINFSLVFARFASIVEAKHSSVPVGLYALDADDIERLDRREGLGRSYDRYLVTPITDDGRAVRCFTYIKRSNKLEPPSPEYYSRLQRGYADWRFDDRRLRHARDRSIRAWENPKHRAEVERERRQHYYVPASSTGVAQIKGHAMRAIAKAVRAPRDAPMWMDDDEPLNALPVVRAPRHCAVASRNVEWGERDGQLYWRIRGERMWYRDTSNHEDVRSGIVRGEIDETLPGAKAFRPVDGNTKGIKHD